MTERVIEPSEIIIERTNKPREDSSHVNPWLRCLARGIDYAFISLLLVWTQRWLHIERYESWIPVPYFLWIPLEAFLLSTWGTTPGKWFLKTRLRQGRREKLDGMTALRRSFSVWFRGFGLGIFGLNFFCMLIAYQRLNLLKSTSWDRDDQIGVTHYPIGRWRIYVAAFIALVGNLSPAWPY